jgi:hypothetical protein
MNRSNWIHIAWALGIQVVIGLLTGNWWAGAAAGSFMFIGREYTQAEYRYIKANGGSRSTTPYLPEIAALHPKWWNRDSVLDWLLPVAVTVAVALVISLTTICC